MAVVKKIPVSQSVSQSTVDSQQVFLAGLTELTDGHKIFEKPEVQLQKSCP